MRATVDKRGSADDVNLIANEIIPIEEANQRFTAGIRINVDQTKHDVELLPKLNEVLRGYPGSQEVSVSVKMETGDTVQVVSKKHRVNITPELRGRLDNLLGLDSHALLIAPPKPSSGNGGHRRGQGKS